MIPHHLLRQRRKSVVANMETNSLLVLLAGEQLLRNADVEYPFRQDSSFLYFTGFEEPNAALLIRKDAEGKYEEILYVQPKMKEKEVWTGVLAGVEGGRAISGVEDVRLWPDLEQDLNGLSKDLHLFYFDKDGYSFKELRKSICASLGHGTIQPTYSLVRPLRVIKDAWEIEQLQQANDYAIAAHKRAFQFAVQALRSGKSLYEYQVAAEIYHEFDRQGLAWSYPAIVAGGNNACVLHYTAQRSALRGDDLMLIDAGCEVNGYAADVTRVYPLSGMFSSAQKLLYEIVVMAQQKAIAEIESAGSTMRSFHNVAVASLVEGLVQTGILKGTREEIVSKRLYLPYYMHGTGHFLGLDVHDVGIVTNAEGQREDIALVPGMVMTVEPGLYIPADDVSVPAEFRGIGIRIEDDIVKTATGILNLTAGLEKDCSALEQLILARK